MPLTLLAGPANAGKVARLLERYRDDLSRDPVLVVPNRAEAGRVERELTGSGEAVVGGSVGTFDDLFDRIAGRNGGLGVLGDAQRQLLVRGVAAAAGGELGPAARFSGFAETLGATLEELDAGLVDPAEHSGDLAALHGAYREELERRGLEDRGRRRRRAAELVLSDIGAWDGRPVYAYGFEDLTGAQWALIQALAGRADVTVSLPYEPGRTAFASLARTSAALVGLADGHVLELPPAMHEFARPALAYVERRLFEGPAAEPPPAIDGALRFLEGAGLRGTLELVGDEILDLVRSGTDPARIAVITTAVERLRAPLETVFGTLGIPYGLEGTVRLGHTPYGAALLALVRFAWLDGGRRDLYGFMRSPYSGLRREHVDFLEGRLRGRAIHTPGRVEEETLKLRGQPLPFLEALRAAASPLAALRELAGAMLRSAHGLHDPPTGEAARLDLRAFESVCDLVDELEAWAELGGEVGTRDVAAALESARVRVGRAYEPGRVAVLDFLSARTRHYEAVFVLGLEEGSLPRRSTPASLLDDDMRAAIEERSPRARLVRPDPVARDRYLFYTACTRAERRLVLVREAVTEDGTPRQPSPFWSDVGALFDHDDVARWTRRRPLSQAVWSLEAAPTERERLRAVASLAAAGAGAVTALARAHGWERRIERARRAFARPTQVTHPAVLSVLAGRTTFSVTELELFADCSALWLVERLVDPRPIDGRVDARLRGTVAHQALFRFFSGLPARFGGDRVDPERLDETLGFLRECVLDAVSSQALNRLELTDVQRLELEQTLLRDLAEFVRDESASELPLVPRRFEVSFGTERSAPELKAGLDLGGFALSGKIDRVDLDPFSARGIVQDYKSGKQAHSAAQIDADARLQVPLYMLVLRDLLGVEPVGGLYRALAGERRARGLLRAADRELLPGFSARDYLADDEFWAVVERAAARARDAVERIRRGEVRHDPRGGFPCPSWCDRGPMCRVRRA